MAVEGKRGCGHRKVGGLYLVGPKLGRHCGKLPIELHVCPTCQAGIKQTRGWIWIDPRPIFDAAECTEVALERRVAAVGGIPTLDFSNCGMCPMAAPVGERFGERVGLLWVGGKFYPEPHDFMDEARDMGISRRIHAPPRGFKLGEHWVVLAHPRAIKRSPRTPAELEELREANRARVQDDLPFASTIVRKGIISVFKPTALELIVTESQAKDAAAMDKLREKGITPVAVPDDDKDHQGSVFDKDDETED